METITSETQWLDMFKSVFQKIQLEHVKFYGEYEDTYILIESTDDDDSEDPEDDFDSWQKHCDDSENNITPSLSSREIIDNRMTKMSPLFALQPKLESICKDNSTQFVISGFTIYRYSSDRSESIDDVQRRVDNLKFITHLWGHNLKELSLQSYPSTEVLQTINATCPNLKKLWLEIEETKNEDCENVFSKMAHLNELRIFCENSIIPTNLIKSIEQVGGTLKGFYLSNYSKVKDRRLPDTFVSVFPRLIVLKELKIYGFDDLNQALIQSIAEIKSLVDLDLVPIRVEDLQTNMSPIGNLKKLKRLSIETDCGITDEFLINLSNNAKNLNNLAVCGTNITDNGIMALSKCSQLKKLDLNPKFIKNNEFITDKSLEYLLLNRKLKELNISNCVEITNSSVLKFVENSTTLEHLCVNKTAVTIEFAKQLRVITEHRTTFIVIHVSKEQKKFFESFQSDKLSFEYGHYSSTYNCS